MDYPEELIMVGYWLVVLFFASPVLIRIYKYVQNSSSQKEEVQSKKEAFWVQEFRDRLHFFGYKEDELKSPIRKQSLDFRFKQLKAISPVLGDERWSLNRIENNYQHISTNLEKFNNEVKN